MSFREAKLELKARGFKDPARNPLYKTKVRNLVSQNITEKYDDHTFNLKPTSSGLNRNSEVNHNRDDAITTSNSFKVLETVEVEVHQEDTENEQQTEMNNKQNKRPYEKLSPVRNTNENSKRSVKPKIQRNLNDLQSIMKCNEVIDNKEAYAIPSPVFTSKFKISRKQNSDKIHEANCKCLDCFQSDISQCSRTAHDSSCGCHECFVEECKVISPLTKDKLINIIRSFINDRSSNNESPLDSHESECMCRNHLIYYKKNKVSILDKFLSQLKSKNNNVSKNNTS